MMVISSFSAKNSTSKGSILPPVQNYGGHSKDYGSAHVQGWSWREIFSGGCQVETRRPCLRIVAVPKPPTMSNNTSMGEKAVRDKVSTVFAGRCGIQCLLSNWHEC